MATFAVKLDNQPNYHQAAAFLAWVIFYTLEVLQVRKSVPIHSKCAFS